MNSKNPITSIFQAYEEGRPALLVTGRSLYDFVVTDGKMRPLIEAFRREALERHGLVTITYSLAAGLEWSETVLRDERDRQTVRNTLRSNHLTDVPRDSNEAAAVMRGIASLNRSAANGVTLSDGRPLRFATVLEFSEHIAPALNNGLHTDPQLLAIELAYLVGHSLQLRTSGNMLIFHGREGLIDGLVASALHTLRLPLPDSDEKLAFVDAARTVYADAAFDSGLKAAEVATLLTNTPNRRLEALMRSSHRQRQPINIASLTALKNCDVEELSEGTLTSLDVRRVENLRLVGRNIEKPAQVLARCAEGLRRGDACIPANILLAGAPSTGKTDLALLTAWQAKTSAYQLHSPKTGIVGETERKARIQQTVSREWVPNVCFVDEITESLPMERSDFDGDSGASRAVMAAMLTALSDESKRGKSLLIATTNCAWRMSAAMRSRFIVLPVLMPLPHDYPAILAAIARSVDRTAEITADAVEVTESAGIFAAKNASPRQMRAALSTMLMMTGRLSKESVVSAARDFTGSQDYASAVFADLWAVRACTSRFFLPWASDPANYPFPAHLAGLVDEHGELQTEELDRRIEEFGKRANV